LSIRYASLRAELQEMRMGVTQLESEVDPFYQHGQSADVTNVTGQVVERPGGEQEGAGVRFRVCGVKWTG
jgi:hypothetical protein